MITSVFRKSKPINFIIVAAYMIVIFVVFNFTLFTSDFNELLKTFLKLGISLFFVFILDFVVSKNSLSKKNSYAILTFGLLFGLFPEAFNHSNALVANLLVLFALRRLLSLHSNLTIKKKFLDAGFWIMLATLFYLWSALFFLIVIVALMYYSQNNVKNIIVPIIGACTVVVLLFAYNIVRFDTYFQPSDIDFAYSLDFTVYNSKQNIIRLTVLVVAFIWTSIYYLNNLSDKNKRLKPSYFIVFFAAIAAFIIAFIAPDKNGSEFVFLFAPFSIIMSNYIEDISERWFKEIFIVLLLLVPIISLLL